MDNLNSNLKESDNLESKKKEILEDLIKTVPHSLSVALIKITQLNNYAPLPLEKYYTNILPAFDLLRRTDGSKYKIHTKTTVRSAMVSNKLYSRNSEGLYELNINNAIKHLQMIKQKKTIDEIDYDNSALDNNNDNDNVYNPSYEKKREKDKNYERMEINQYNDDLNNMENKPRTKTRAKMDPIEKKKRKLLKITKTRRETVKNKIEKYVKTFELLKKLLKISDNDSYLRTQINIDFSEIGDGTNLNDKQINIDKIIGMLTVFKFFRSFLEKCFNAIRIHDSLRNKICELNSESNYIEAIFRSEE